MIHRVLTLLATLCLLAAAGCNTRLEKDMRVKIALVLAILFGVCGSAHADWYMVGAREFRPESSYTNWSTYLQRVYVDPSGIGLSLLYAPVRLPVGATIESLWCHVYDNNPAASMSVRLQRHDHLVTSSRVDIHNILSAYSSRPDALGPQEISDVSPNSRYEVVKDWDGFATTTYYTYYLQLTDSGGCEAGCGIYSCAIGYQP